MLVGSYKKHLMNSLSVKFCSYIDPKGKTFNISNIKKFLIPQQTQHSTWSIRTLTRCGDSLFEG